MHKSKVFLSGGFKSGWQNEVLQQLSELFIFFNPQTHGLRDYHQYTTWDIHFVKQCDIFFGYMETSNPSGYGLAFELGMAYSLNKTIILVDEKSEHDEQFARYYQILHKSSGVVFASLSEGINYLKKFSMNI